MPGPPVFHCLPEWGQIHVGSFSDTVQPSHPLSSPSPLALTLSEHQGLFQGVFSSHEMAKVLEPQRQDLSLSGSKNQHIHCYYNMNSGGTWSPSQAVMKAYRPRLHFLKNWKYSMGMWLSNYL